MANSKHLPLARHVRLLLLCLLAGCMSHQPVAVTPARPVRIAARPPLLPATRPVVVVRAPLAKLAALPARVMGSALDEPPQISPIMAHPAHDRTVMMEVTGYCPCKVCCGRRAHGITASGHSVRYNGGAFAAADTSVLPFHSRIIVPGYNRTQAVPVIDRGGDIVGNRLDVFFTKHAAAEKWGRRLLAVTIVR